MSVKTRIKYFMVCNKCGSILTNNHHSDEFSDLGEVFEAAEVSGWFVDGHDITYCDECRKTGSNEKTVSVVRMKRLGDGGINSCPSEDTKDI